MFFYLVRKQKSRAIHEKFVNLLSFNFLKITF
nr:MAG TPA: hypothetical protein [Caudoviricetes sp.]